MRYMSTFCTRCQPQVWPLKYQWLNRRLLFRLLLLCLCWFVVLPASAEDSGHFEIVNADFRVDDGMWLADARADLELSKQTLAALENSVALTIQYQFTVSRQRNFWPDKVIAERQQSFKLQYLSLSRRYVVHNVVANEQESYATLFSALRQIGQLRDFPILAASKMDPDDQHDISLRVVLNRENLPGPLQVLVFWRGDFSLESEWYRWTVN